jgi:hypothetical protein
MPQYFYRNVHNIDAFEMKNLYYYTVHRFQASKNGNNRINIFMLRKRSRIVLYVSPVIVVILLLQIFFDLKVPHSIDTYFEVNPAQKWILSKGPSGQIISNLIDYTSVVSNNFSVVQFVRGESMNLTLNDSFKSKSTITKGDTIGRINSSDLQERLAELEGSLLVAKANLAAGSTGEKQSMIDAAKSRVEVTGAALSQKRLAFQRAEELNKKGYMPQGEYETYLWDLRQTEILQQVNQAQLAEMTTGLKKEDIQVLQTTINANINELRVIRNRMDESVLTAPISGDIAWGFSRDTLFKVNNMSQVVLTALIRYGQIPYLSEGQPVQISLRNISGELTGRVVSISREMTVVGGTQVLPASILLESPDKRLVPGLLIAGEIILPKITIKDFVLSILRN